MADDDGWTTIARGKSAGRAGIQVVKSPAINGANASATVAHLQRDFARKLRIWKASSCRRTLLQILRRNAPDDGGWGFTKAVCLATGSFSTMNSELNRRALMQVALFVDVVAEMAGEGEVEMLAQEPKYGEVDVEFLQGMGVRVLPTATAGDGIGSAREHFESSTLVCDFFLNMGPAAARDFFAAEHGLYIGTPFNQTLMSEGSGMGRVRDAFVERYEMRKMPWFEEDPGVLEGLMVYWPRPAEDD